MKITERDQRLQLTTLSTGRRANSSDVLRSVVMLALLLLPNLAQAWWNDAWPYRLSVKINASTTGANLSENVANVPVLLRLHGGNFEDFFLVKEDLSDLRFVAGDDKTPLKFQVDHFDLINQMLFIWVNVPEITSGINTEKIWMYYGNAEAVAMNDDGGIFDVNQSAVVHFTKGTAEPTDSTAYKNQLVLSNGQSHDASLIGPGVKFDGKMSLQFPDVPGLHFGTLAGATMTAWIKPDAKQKTATLLYRKDAEGNSFQMRLDQNSISFDINSAGAVTQFVAKDVVASERWQHLALIINQDQVKLFVDAQEVASKKISAFNIAGPIYMGANPSSSNGFRGEMDEIRLSNSARSTNWIHTAFQNQGMQDTLLTITQAEQLGSGAGAETGFFAVIFRSTGPTGWTIIGMCLVMSLVSWMVMIGKAFYITYAQRDNQKFMVEYNNCHNEDPAMLDFGEESKSELDDSPVLQAIFGNHDHFESSPIYHMYHHGIKEVQGRLGKSVGARATGLTPQAVSAIRASLDAQMIREAQRLNSKMILLTIAISGGPFLGLLGTVIGVMITFAAIAATGDVNIAAIAPGVAAALLTTVAGLFVAIPALFGYNYLTSSIKEAIVDMRVFLDEFVSQLEEYYGQGA